MASSGLPAICRELSAIHRKGVFDDLAELSVVNETKLTIAAVITPREGAYAGMRLTFHIALGTNYPQSPPTVTARTHIYHPNMTESSICFSMLQDDWDPAYRLEHVVNGIMWLLDNPNSQSMLNGEFQSPDSDLETDILHTRIALVRPPHPSWSYARLPLSDATDAATLALALICSPSRKSRAWDLARARMDVAGIAALAAPVDAYMAFALGRAPTAPHAITRLVRGPNMYLAAPSDGFEFVALRRHARTAKAAAAALSLPADAVAREIFLVADNGDGYLLLVTGAAPVDLAALARELGHERLVLRSRAPPLCHHIAALMDAALAQRTDRLAVDIAGGGAFLVGRPDVLPLPARRVAVARLTGEAAIEARAVKRRAFDGAVFFEYYATPDRFFGCARLVGLWTSAPVSAVCEAAAAWEAYLDTCPQEEDEAAAKDEADATWAALIKPRHVTLMEGVLGAAAAALLSRARAKSASPGVSTSSLQVSMSSLQVSMSGLQLPLVEQVPRVRSGALLCRRALSAGAAPILKSVTTGHVTEEKMARKKARAAAAIEWRDLEEWLAFQRGISAIDWRELVQCEDLFA